MDGYTRDQSNSTNYYSIATVLFNYCIQINVAPLIHDTCTITQYKTSDWSPVCLSRSQPVTDNDDNRPDGSGWLGVVAVGRHAGDVARVSGARFRTI